MLHKGKLVVFICSAIIVLYGVSAAFDGRVGAKDEAYPALNVFMDALRRVSSDYVEAPDMTKVQEGAMRGLIEALDPYSTFLTKEKAQALDSRKDRTARCRDNPLQAIRHHLCGRHREKRSSRRRRHPAGRLPDLDRWSQCGGCQLPRGGQPVCAALRAAK